MGTEWFSLFMAFGSVLLTIVSIKRDDLFGVMVCGLSGILWSFLWAVKYCGA